jgi:hypothetical protein
MCRPNMEQGPTIDGVINISGVKTNTPENPGKCGEDGSAICIVVIRGCEISGSTNRCLRVKWSTFMCIKYPDIAVLLAVPNTEFVSTQNPSLPAHTGILYRAAETTLIPALKHNLSRKKYPNSETVKYSPEKIF